MVEIPTKEVRRLYAQRDTYALSPHFEHHMLALTGEGLTGKAAIARELAYRDSQIERLKGVAWEARAALRRFEMDVREVIRNGGMTQASRVVLARAADRADESEKTAMKELDSHD